MLNLFRRFSAVYYLPEKYNLLIYSNIASGTTLMFEIPGLRTGAEFTEEFAPRGVAGDWRWRARFPQGGTREQQRH